MTGGLEHAMLNCPSAVDGARTELRPTATGIDVIVTANTPDATAEIARLAAYHAAQDQLSEWPPHTGFHGGPATIGHCPVVHEGTRISSTRVQDGAVLHVTALRPDRIRSVQDETAQRLAALPTWLPRPAP
jgi:hypothetical protein